MRAQPVHQAVARAHHRPGHAGHRRPDQEPRRKRPGHVGTTAIAGDDHPVAHAGAQIGLRDYQHQRRQRDQAKAGMHLLASLQPPVMIKPDTGQCGGGDRRPQQQDGQGDLAQSLQQQQGCKKSRQRQCRKQIAVIARPLIQRAALQQHKQPHALGQADGKARQPQPRCLWRRRRGRGDLVGGTRWREIAEGVVAGKALAIEKRGVRRPFQVVVIHPAGVFVFAEKAHDAGLAQAGQGITPS